ncbi:MAG: flagellar hook-length control protein FliK, partial [Chromatiaceae bacterium]|nr:flagellar hook-length control protein FliK [Chromatiaceae bacterium]
AEQILRDRAARPGSDIFEASLLAEGELEAESGREALESATDGLVQASATFSSGRAPEVAGALARPLVFDLRELLQPGGAQRLAEQIQWMARAGEDMAELKLHPPSLGALDVRIAMEGDKTHVQFFSASPVVREVLEAALPRLREALGQENLMLGDASVSDYPSQGRGDGGGQGSGTPSGSGGAWGADEAVRDEEVGPLPDQTLHVLARRLDFFV